MECPRSVPAGVAAGHRPVFRRVGYAAVGCGSRCGNSLGSPLLAFIERNSEDAAETRLHYRVPSFRRPDSTYLSRTFITTPTAPTHLSSVMDLLRSGYPSMGTVGIHRIDEHSRQQRRPAPRLSGCRMQSTPTAAWRGGTCSTCTRQCSGTALLLLHRGTGSPQLRTNSQYGPWMRFPGGGTCTTWIILGKTG